MSDHGTGAGGPGTASEQCRGDAPGVADRPDGVRGNAVVLALDFGGTKIAAAVREVAAAAGDGAAPGAGRGATAERTGVVDTSPELGAEANVSRALHLAHRLLEGSPVAAVGACTFGIPHEDGVALSPAVEGWDRVPLRRRLMEAFGAPVAVVTDVKAAAAAEARHGALAGADPAIYVNLGTGLGVGIVANGTVLQGAHGAAGEIGYNLLRAGGTVTISNGDAPGRAEPGTRARSGPGTPHARPKVLEDVVSGMGLARALGADAHAGDSSGPGRRSTGDADRVARLFAAGPPRRRNSSDVLGQPDGGSGAGEAGAGSDATSLRHTAILRDFLEELCFQLVNLTIAVDPERIAVGGGLVRSWDRIEGPLRDALGAHVPFPPQLVLGAYPFDAALRGAIDIGVELASQSAGSGAAPAPKGASTDSVHAIEGGDPC